METTRIRRAKEVFQRVVELPREQRAAALAQDCAGDDELRALVDELLTLDLADLGDFMRKPVFTPPADRHPDRFEDSPRQIGRYEIVRVVGEGGMGVVYEARQDHPSRTVALKIIRSALPSRDMRRRFEHEAEVLGRLQHPGIAHIYEAATAEVTTAGGAKIRQPFFAMEFIRGVPLTEYATRHNLSVRARLELVAKICEGVQHAHQHGVIHRDLKPGNILVDEHGDPKILDFGVARVTDADLQTVTMQTDLGQLVGTVPYMSPEQVTGNSRQMDTRSDVFSLGVLLYELLSGKLPHDVRAKSIAEAARQIRDEDPVSLGLIDRTFRGEIETIVARALEKDKSRRYQSAGELAADIRRYERGEPIEAKRDSAFYVLGKTLRRHRGLVTGAALVVLLVAVFGIVSFFQAERNRRLAERADATSARLRRELTASNIERGRLFGQAGHLLAAERLIWREHLQQPKSQHSFWALWELYSCSPTLAAVTANPAVRAVAFAPDGRLIAGGHNGGTVSLWDARTFCRAATLRGHTDTACGLAFSPNGRFLASASFDGTVKIWDLASREAVHTLPAHPRGARAVSYSPDGTYLVSTGEDATIRIWDAATGNRIGVLEGHTGPIVRLRFNRDGTLLASGSDDCTIKLWRELSNPAIATLCGHTNGLYALAFSPDERTLASGSSDKTIKFWDLATFECIDTIAAANGSIRFLWFTPDAQTLIAGGWWRIDAWDLPTHTRRQLQAHGVTDCAPSADISPDHRLIATYYDGSLRVADIGADAGLLHLDGQTGQGKAALSPDGRVIASGHASGDVALWETATGRLLATLPPHTARVSASHFDPTGTLLATCYADGLVRLWDLATGRVAMVFDGQHTKSRYSLSFAPDGRTLASTRPDGSVELRDVPSGRVTVTLPPMPSETLSARFSPDGQTLAVTYREYRVRLYSPGGELQAEFDTMCTPWTVAFRPDGRKLAVGCWWAYPIQVWDLAANTREICLEEPQTVVWEVAYLPTNPRILASASGDGAVRLWDLQAQRNVLTLQPFGDFDAHSLSFTPDGKTLLAAGTDGSVCVWDLEYFERHMAGNLHHQIETLRPELGDAIQTEFLTTWAAEVLQRPWPRIGPYAKQIPIEPTSATNTVGVSPEVIASWGARGLDAPSPP